MNGMSSQRIASRAFPTEWELNWLEALLLLGSGSLIVVLHQSLRLPLSMPGWQGIGWMALLIIGRMSSRFRGAASVASVGASLTSLVPVLRGGDSFIWLIYLLPGPVMDAAFYYMPRYANKLWFLVLLGGVAHITKPLIRLMINIITGWPFGSFRFGVEYPVATHFLFGLIGGLLGALVVLGLHRFLPKSIS